MKNTIKRLAAFGVALVWPLGFVVHCITILVAYRELGVISAIGTALLPGGAELYWGVHMWWTYGFQAGYVIILLAFSLFCILLLTCSYIANLGD